MRCSLFLSPLTYFGRWLLFHRFASTKIHSKASIDRPKIRVNSTVAMARIIPITNSTVSLSLGSGSAYLATNNTTLTILKVPYPHRSTIKTDLKYVKPRCLGIASISSMGV